MAIAVKLDDLLHDRRMTLTELADRVGMTLANLSILKTGKARAIRFSISSCSAGSVGSIESSSTLTTASPVETLRLSKRNTTPQFV